jgi:hypothetical protein
LVEAALREPDHLRPNANSSFSLRKKRIFFAYLIWVPGTDLSENGFLAF